MINRLLTRDCIVVHRQAGGTDDYGNPQSTETLTAVRCYAEQRRSTEPAGVGERAATDWLIVIPPHYTEVTIADAIRLDDGTELEVVADPWPVHNPRARTFDHVELLARETA